MTDQKYKNIYFSAILCALLLNLRLAFEYNSLLNIITYILSYLLPAFVAFYRMKPDSRKDVFKFKFTSGSLYLCSAAYFVIITTNLLASNIFGTHSYAVNPDFYTVLFSAILVPVFEEIFWRGCLTSVFSQFGTLPALIIPSLLFGLLHSGLAGMLFSTFAGIVFSYMFLSVKSIVPGIIVHLLNNLISLLILKYEFILPVSIVVSLVIIVIGCTRGKFSRLSFKIDWQNFDTSCVKNVYIYLTLFIFVFIRIMGGIV